MKPIYSLICQMMLGGLFLHKPMFSSESISLNFAFICSNCRSSCLCSLTLHCFINKVFQSRTNAAAFIIFTETSQWDKILSEIVLLLCFLRVKLGNTPWSFTIFLAVWTRYSVMNSELIWWTYYCCASKLNISLKLLSLLILSWRLEIRVWYLSACFKFSGKLIDSSVI